MLVMEKYRTIIECATVSAGDFQIEIAWSECSSQFHTIAHLQLVALHCVAAYQTTAAILNPRVELLLRRFCVHEYVCESERVHRELSEGRKIFITILSTEKCQR